MNWKQAFTLGLLAPGVWEGERVPVAYSYNEVVLPGLPELENPYVWIGYDNYYESYMLYAFAQPLHVANNDAGYGLQAETSGRYVRYWNVDGAWGNSYEYYFPGATASQPDCLPFSTHTVIWTNTDILNEDGTVYMEASTPIPVYE